MKGGVVGLFARVGGDDTHYHTQKSNKNSIHFHFYKDYIHDRTDTLHTQSTLRQKDTSVLQKGVRQK